MNFTETLQSLTGKPLSACTNQELYLALLELVRRKSADRVQPVTGRKLYYISAEFLIGKLLSNNLINQGMYDEARDAMTAAVSRCQRGTSPATVWACGITFDFSDSPLKTVSRMRSPTRGSPPTAGPKRPISPIR